MHQLTHSGCRRTLVALPVVLPLNSCCSSTFSFLLRVHAWFFFGLSGTQLARFASLCLYLLLWRAAFARGSRRAAGQVWLMGWCCAHASPSTQFCFCFCLPYLGTGEQETCVFRWAGAVSRLAPPRHCAQSAFYCRYWFFRLWRDRLEPYTWHFGEYQAKWGLCAAAVEEMALSHGSAQHRAPLQPRRSLSMCRSGLEFR